MNLPQAISASPFERFNLVLCTAIFDGDITPTMQTELDKRVETFNKSSPGGLLRPRYTLRFQGNQIIFLQGRMTEAPTRPHFDGFRQELGLIFPNDTVTESVTTQPAQPAQAVVSISAQ